jgi:hypothetical protein
MFPFGAIDGRAKRLRVSSFDPYGSFSMARWSMPELALIAVGLIGAGVVAYLAFKLFGF